MPADGVSAFSNLNVALRVAPMLARAGANAEVVVYPAGAAARALVVPGK